MTEGNVDPETIRKTQESLGKFVKKPPLTEKLLKKPPFKFIHDVIKVVIRDTNFLEELYTDDELNADNIKDRDGKMKFLQKLIDVVKIVTSKDLQVKSSKIVAGLEADKTNELFQAIAYALENKLDSKDAVRTVKHGHQNGDEPKAKAKPGKPEKPTAARQSKAQPASRDRTPSKPEPKKAISTQRSIEKKTTTKEKDKATKERSTSKSRAPADPKKLKKSSPKKETPKVNGEVLTNGSIDSQSSIQSLPRQASDEKPDEPVTVIEPPLERKPSLHDDMNKENEVRINGDAHHEPDSERETQHEPPAKPQDELAAIIDEEAEFRRKEKSTKKLSSKHRQKSVEEPQPAEPPDAHPKVTQAEKAERFQSSYKRESFERPRTSLRPPSARPASSRPAAPRRRDKNVEIVLQPDETMKVGDINIKMESFSKELEDDGENLVIIEDSTVVSDGFINERLTQNKSEEINKDEQGKLVQQILETEKNFEGALGMEAKRTEIEFDETKTQINVKQIEHLKDLIQKLVRSVNPLGKLTDFIQEDIDSMQREYTKWNEIHKQATIDLKKEQMETASAIEPLKYQLNQLDKLIEEHHESIDQLRGNLVLSEQRIVKMFTDV